MKTLSGLHKLITEGRLLQQIDKLALKYKTDPLPFAELKAALKALGTALAKNKSQLGTKPDQLAARIWESCEGHVFFSVMDYLSALKHLASDHEEIAALLKLPVFANHEIMRAYVCHALPDTVNLCIHNALERQPQLDVRWQLGFTVGDQSERPVLLMHSSANGSGEYDKLEIGQLYPVGSIGTLMEQMQELLASTTGILEAYLADPAKWVSPERDSRAAQKEVLTLIASLDSEQKAMLRKVCQRDPGMLQQALAAAG